MKCSNCGAELREGAKFCPNCGATNTAAGSVDTAGAAGGTPPPGGIPGSGKHRGMGLIIGGGVAVVAVIAVIIVAVSGLFASPQDRLEKALAKTMSAYAEISEKMGMPDLTQLSERQSMTQRLSLELASVNEQLVGYDLSFLKGLGLRLDTDLDGAGRKMAAELAAYWDEEEIIGAQILVEDNVLSISVPQLTGGDFYSIDTLTMGADLADLTGDASVEDISFNLFDLMETATPTEETQAEMEQALDQAAQALLDAMEVEKIGSETIDVNGKNVDADAYDVLIPQTALEDYANAMLDALQTVDYMELYEETLRAMGIPGEQIDAVMEEMGGDPYRELADGIELVLDELGDLELTVYVNSGYLSAVVFDDRGVEIGLYLGGGEEYVDDLSLEISADEDRLIIESSGDHGGKSGVFTDETTIRGQSGGETLFRVTSEYSYEPGAEDSNLLWELSADDLGSLEIEGQMTATEDSLDVMLENISVKAMGMELIALEGEYYVGPCEGIELSADDALRILELSDAELEELAMDWEASAMDWVSDLEQMAYDKLPEELLWALMYGLY